MIRRVMSMCLLMIVAAIGCQKEQNGKPVRGEVPIKDESRFNSLSAGIEHDGDRAEEARAWLDPQRTENKLWKTSRSQTLQFVNDLYAAGAVKVYAIYKPKEGTVPINMCAELFLELPADQEKRQKVIKQMNKIEKILWGDDAEKGTEQGQKYLYLNMDA